MVKRRTRRKPTILDPNRRAVPVGAALPFATAHPTPPAIDSASTFDPDALPIPVYSRSNPLPTPLEPGTFAGALLVDKPKGLSSFGVIRRLRRALSIKKMGHAGTLDPMATGLLIVLVGRPATRLQDQFMGQPKRYTGTVTLGVVTDSFDAEGAVIAISDAEVEDDAVEAALPAFRGEIEQVPPAFSAIKVGGERLYKKARRGEDVEVPKRVVRIDRFDVTERRGDDLDILVDCSKGTYIRSLAHALGAALGPGGHLSALRRERIGPYDVADAFDLDAIAPFQPGPHKPKG
jgi:tRNA pseudouridine55 synthase